MMVRPGLYLILAVYGTVPVSQQIRLVHEVSGENDGAPRLVLDEQVPDSTARIGVNPRCGLVQDNHSDEQKRKMLEHFMFSLSLNPVFSFYLFP